MTREDRLNEIRDYVGYLDRLANEVLQGRPSITVLGFSQGTATAARWVTHGSVAADRLILWAGHVPHDQDLERGRQIFARTELVLVRGDADPGLSDELAQSERAALGGADIPYRLVSYEGGHDIEAETLRSLVSG